MPMAIPVSNESVAELCHRYRIRELSVFGSVLRPDFRPDSDVDVLVDFLPEAQVGLFDLMDLQDELERLFGRKVDLVTKPALRPELRDVILASREVLYVTEG